MATLKEFASSDGTSKAIDPVSTPSSKRARDNTEGQNDINSETKAEAMKNLMAQAALLGKTDIDNIFKAASALGGASKRPADSTDQQPITSVQNYWAKEDVEELFTGEQFSEDFKAKISTIFEAAVTAKVTVIEEEIREGLTEEFQSELDEAVKEIEAQLSEDADKYLTYVAEDWVDNNRLEIEANSKVELAESFIAGLKELFETHNVDVSDDTVDLVSELETTNNDLVDKYNELFEDNANLRDAIVEYQKDDIFAEISEGMVSTQIDKLLTLSESLSYSSLEDFRVKLSTLKESVTGKISKDAPKVADLNESLVSESESNGSEKSRYKLASDRFAKK